MKLPDKLPALQDQVCNLEQSRKLWELGVRLESLYMWEYSEYYGKAVWVLREKALYDYDTRNTKANWDRSNDLPAYTGSELDHLLPFICGCMKLRKGYKMRRLSGSWFDDNPPHPTPAIAKAALLIHLIEEGEVTV